MLTIGAGVVSRLQVKVSGLSVHASSREMTTSVPLEMRAVVARNGSCFLEQHRVPLPRPGEILVRTHVSALNRADTLQRKGVYPPPSGVTEVLGLELAGEVVDYVPAEPSISTVAALSVDPAVTIPGARVMALVSGGGNAEYACFPAAHAMLVPPAMDWHTAGAIPETWLTAFQLLHLVAGVEAGQTVLIHAAGSGVGTAAIQLAVRAGCTVIAVAGMDEKLEVARRLGASRCFNYKSEPALWGEELKGVVDVILDPVGGSFWKSNADACNMDATWVLYGSMGGGSVEGSLFAHILRKRIKLVGTTLRSRSDAYKADLTARFVEKALPFLSNGSMVPVIDSIYPLGEVQQAHERMESNANTGKILLQVV